jgi:hypothetical protein
LQKKKHKNKHKKIKSKPTQSSPKILLITSEDTMMIRDFILNELKSDYNLRIQRISGTQRRNAQTFKNSITEGTQSTVQYA